MPEQPVVVHREEPAVEAVRAGDVDGRATGLLGVERNRGDVVDLAGCGGGAREDQSCSHNPVPQPLQRAESGVYAPDR